MDKYNKFFFSFVLILSFLSCLFLINRGTEDVHERYRYDMTDSFNAEILQLDTDENRGCEGKIHTSPMPLKLKIRQYARKKLAHDLCSNNISLDINGKWQTFDQIPLTDLSNLLVDNRHGIIYCYVPKVACTAWKRIIIVLSESLKVHGVPYRSPADIPIEEVHASSIQKLNAYPMAVMKKKLETYKKFIFVRDPFVRLISAYRDKIENKNQVYYKSVGMHILTKFRNVSNLPASVEDAHAEGKVPSFYNFIQFILSLSEKKGAFVDEHWRPANQLCHPCLIEYDFIGKMETIDEDAAQLLRMLHVDNVVNLQPSINSKTEANAIKTWFSNIPVKWRRKLYNIYEADFRLFGYKNHDNLDNLDPENII